MHKICELLQDMLFEFGLEFGTMAVNGHIGQCDEILTKTSFAKLTHISHFAEIFVSIVRKLKASENFFL